VKIYRLKILLIIKVHPAILSSGFTVTTPDPALLSSARPNVVTMDLCGVLPVAGLVCNVSPADRVQRIGNTVRQIMPER
jgi:hypothetical protein